jgi:hypothetical protein
LFLARQGARPLRAAPSAQRSSPSSLLAGLFRPEGGRTPRADILAPMSPADSLLQRLHALFTRAGEPLPKGATRNEIAWAQRDSGLEFPPELKEWFSLCGPARLPDCGDELTGPIYGKQVGWGYDEFYRHGLISVAQDGCGNHWCLGTQFRTSHRPVVFVEMHDLEHEGNYLAASGLWPFLDMFLTYREEQLADEDASPRWFSRSRHPQADPDIISIPALENFPLAWESE